MDGSLRRHSNFLQGGFPPPRKESLWRVRTAAAMLALTSQFFIPLFNFSVSTCPHYPNDEDLNIWEESEADKLPIGEHQVQSQGLSVLR